MTAKIISHRPAIQAQPGLLTVEVLQSGAAGLQKLNLQGAFEAYGNSPQGGLLMEHIKQVIMPKGVELNSPIWRVGPVTGVAAAPSGKCRVTLANHRLHTGEKVTIRQVQGCTEANVIQSRIARTGANTFDLVDVTFVNAFSTSAASIVEVRRPFVTSTLSGYSTSTRRWTTAAAHGLAVNETVYLAGVTGLSASKDIVNVPLRVIEVPSSTTFIVDLPGITGTFGGTSPTVVAARSIRSMGLLRFTLPALLNVAGVASTTFTTTELHNLLPGDVVSVCGVAGATGANGVKRVVTVPSTTTFTAEELDGSAMTLGGSYTSGGVIVANTTAPANLEQLADISMLLGSSQDQMPWIKPLYV